MLALGGRFVMTTGTRTMPKLFANSLVTRVLRASIQSRILAKEEGKSGWITSPVTEMRHILAVVCIMAGATMIALTSKMLESFVKEVAIILHK